MNLRWIASALFVCLAGLVALAASAQTAEEKPAPVSAAGGWSCTVEMDSDEFDVSLAIFQKDDGTLKGAVSGPSGEFELTGTVSRSQVTIKWNQPIGGRLVPFTLTGELKGDQIEGPADLSSKGKGWFTAQRQ